MSTDRAWLERLPKVELHVHLEGSIPIEALWELVQKYGGDPTLPNQEALKQKFVYRDFPHFIETWVWKNQFIRDYEDLTFIAEAVARDWQTQNIQYVEAFCSPGDFHRQGLETQKILEAFRRGLDRVKGIRINIVADLIRDFGPERGASTLEEINEARDLGIIGVGIGGSEQAFPPEPFTDVFERARELGFCTSAHAGEAAGPESVWGAITALCVDRVGHGTRAVEDPELVKYLADEQIPIELNPISNVKTGVIPTHKAHPVRTYFDLGIPITINTDDPKMFGNSLVDEYEALQCHHNFTDDEIRDVILMGIETSWLDEEEKEYLRRSFVSEPSWLQSSDSI